MSIQDSAEHYGILKEFRFRDPEVERQYCVKVNEWAVWPARCHAVLVLIQCTAALTSFIGGSLSISFWAFTFPIPFAVLMLLGSFCSKYWRQNIVAISCFYCIFCTILDSFLLYEQTYRWQIIAFERGMPTLATQRLDANALAQVHAYVLSNSLANSIAVHLMMNVYQLTFLSIMAFNWWTITATWIMVPSFMIAALLTAGCSVMTICLLVVRLITTCSIYSALGVLISKIRRMNFMAELLIAQKLHASQMADSMLNHGLKNTMADAASNMELYINGDLPIQALHSSIAALRRGMRSCRERQIYLRLVSGEYSPIMTATNLEDFGQQLIAGRDVIGHFTTQTVLLDQMLCNLILDNAINNAFRHGYPQSPSICFSIEEEEVPIGTDALPPHHQRIIFTVTNRANPSRPPLTPEFVAQMLSGQGPFVQQDNAPVMSDRIGLSHCFLAAKQHGIHISLTQDDETVRFVAVYNAPLAPQTSRSPRNPPKDVARLFPHGLNFWCIDDSMASRQLLDFHISKWLAPGVVRCLGESEQDIESFVEGALEQADIAILDQNLEYTHSYLGTDLAKQLQDRGFSGLICIRSANSSQLDVAFYQRFGVHCVLGKDLQGATMAEQVKAAYVRLVRNGVLHPRPAVPGLSLCSCDSHPDILELTAVSSL